MNPVEAALQQQAMGLQLKQIEAQNRLASAETAKTLAEANKIAGGVMESKNQTEKMSTKTNFPAYKTVSTDSLVPYARNSRTHSEKQVDKIAASIKEFGFLNPVIVDGENGIIAGHGRVMAAKKLGLTELPVVEASHLTDAQRRAYVIADNRLALDAGSSASTVYVSLK